MSNNLLIKDIISKFSSKNGRVLSVLEEIQRRFRYLSEDNLRLVADELGLPLSQVYGVATFYNYFSLEPKGEHIIGVCHGTACHVRGAGKLTAELEKKLGISVEGTTSDGLFSLETVRCLGCCSLAPVVSIDGVIHARVKPDSVSALLKLPHTEVDAND